MDTAHQHMIWTCQNIWPREEMPIRSIFMSAFFPKLSFLQCNFPELWMYARIEEVEFTHFREQFGHLVFAAVVKAWKYVNYPYRQCCQARKSWCKNLPRWFFVERGQKLGWPKQAPIIANIVLRCLISGLYDYLQLILNAKLTQDNVRNIVGKLKTFEITLKVSFLKLASLV